MRYESNAKGRFALIVGSVLALLAFGGGGLQAEESESGVVAIVNGEPIYFEDLESRLQEMHSGQSESSRGRFDLRELVEQIVDDTLLAQEARVLGMDEEPAVAQRVAARARSLAVERLERDEVEARSEPTAEEVRAAFERDYRTADVRLITTRDPAIAEEIRGRLEAGEDFETLARERSVDSYSAQGGLVKGIAAVDLPQGLREAAFDRPPGELVGPLATSLGWAIVRTEAISPADPERFPALERRVRESVRWATAARLREELGRRLRQAHSVEVDRALLDGIEIEPLESGRLIPVFRDSSAVVARIEEREIVAADLERALRARWKGMRNEEVARAAAPLVLDQMIQDELMLVEALDRGFDRTPEVRRQVAAFERRILVPRFLKEVLAAGVRVEEAEARALYELQREEFRRPARLHVSQITVPTREEAERLAGLVRSGADFAWLARRHSTDDLREKGGEKGWVEPVSGVSELLDRLRTAKQGDIVGPVGAEGHFTIVRVNTLEDQGFVAFEQARPRLDAAISASKFEKVLVDVLAKLREHSEIGILEDVLATMEVSAGRSEPQEGPPGHAH